MEKFICNICNKELKNERSYNAHITYHKNKEKYPNGIKCPHCDLVCETVKSLLIHNSLHHKEIEKQKVVYELLSNDSTVHQCVVCNKEALFIDAKTGYSKTCSDKCKKQLKVITTTNNHKTRDHQIVYKKCQETWIISLGVDNPRKSKKIEEQIIATNNIRYGEDYGFKAKVVKEKIKKSNIETYGIDNFCKSNKYKSLYKDPIWFKAKQCKEYNTKRKNHSFKSSKPEKELYEKLLLLYTTVEFQKIDYPNFPFNVDYYIPEYDLLIELQGSWTHGKEPFDELNEKHIEVLSKWQEKAKTSKYYARAIDVWTTRDVNKFKLAKSLNLNYLRLYTTDVDKCIDEIQKYIDQYTWTK